MKKIITWLLLLTLLLPSCALGSSSYIIHDSDTRELSWEELYQWDYESLGYILNEIFARHGYDFIPGEKYDRYFRERSWYTPNQSYDKNATCYKKLSSLEWYNESLVKDVRASMRASGDYNTDGLSIWNNVFEVYRTVVEFSPVSMPRNQSLPVYSGPGTQYHRGANGRAKCSTNGPVYACGYESGWLMIMYETNNGSVRIGYTPANFKGNVNLPTLYYLYSDVQLSQSVNLTDDPVKTNSSLGRLSSGTPVVYLDTFHTDRSWAHIEARLNGEPVRGFVPLEAIDEWYSLNTDEPQGQSYK